MSSGELGQAIISVIGQIVEYGGAGAIAAFALFRFLGQKWIEGKFAERLEAYKHAQNKELEEVRLKIDSMFNRLLKFHDKEFEILPIAWGNLNDAYQAVMRCISRLREHPDLDALSECELDAFLSNARLGETQKNRIKKSSRKTNVYHEILSWMEMDDAHKSFLEFHFYITRNRIFLSPELKSKFDRADNIMWGMWVDRKLESYPGLSSQFMKDFRENTNAIKAVLLDIEALVEARLRPSEPV